MAGHSAVALPVHVLQAHWNWLWIAKNRIESSDKPKLLLLFRTMVYAETDEEFENREADMRENPVFKKYKNYENYVNNMMERKEEWSLVHRINEKLPTSNHNTTNLCETSFRREKDDVFNRHRAYNLTDMVQIVVASSEGYSMRCVDAANSTLHQRLKNQKSQYLIQKTKIDPTKIKTS